MSKRTFEKYKGEQVSQIPAGYVEGMGAMGKAYESIGKSIGSMIANIGTMMAQTQDIKDKATDVTNLTNEEVGRFIKSGDLIRSEDGSVAPAPGKEGMFNSEKLNNYLSIYNITKGRPATELSGRESQRVLNQYQSNVEREKTIREERALALKEQEGKLAFERSGVELDLKKKELENKVQDAENERREKDRAFLLTYLKESSSNLSNTVDANSKARSLEFETLGYLDPANETSRKIAEETLRDRVNKINQTLGEDQSRINKEIRDREFLLNGQRQAPQVKPTDNKTSFVPSGVSSEPSTSEAPGVVSIPGGIESQPIGSAGVIVDQNTGVLTINTKGDKTSDFDIPVRTTNDDAYVVGSNTVQGIGITKSSDGKMVVTYNSANGAILKPAVNDIVIANRLYESGRIKNFTPSAEQIEAIKKSGLYPSYAEAGPAWERALVASLVAQGKLAPAPGQNREFLGQGDETVVAYADDSTPSSPVEVVQPQAEMSTIPGMTGLHTVLPSSVVLSNMAKAGVAPSPETLQRLKFRDENARFQNDVVVTIAKAKADFAASRLSEQLTLKEVGETASTFATLGTKLGEAMTGYPGVFESSGQQYGYFSRRLPNNTSSGKPWTKGEIAYIASGITSANNADRESAIRLLPGLRMDLARGQMGDKQLKDASKATADFDNTTGALSSITAELARQVGDGTKIDFLRTTMESIGISPGGGEMRAAKIHQLFLMGSLRETIVGPGNPAIYEQMLLQSAIPSVDALLRIPQWEQQKLQTLALVSAASYIATMRQAGMELTPDSLDYINGKLSSAYGSKFVPFTQEQLIGPKGWMNVRGDRAEAERFLRRNGLRTVGDIGR